MGSLAFLFLTQCGDFNTSIFERRVAKDFANLADFFECLLNLVSIREGNIAVLSSEDDDGLILLADNLVLYVLYGTKRSTLNSIV